MLNLPRSWITLLYGLQSYWSAQKDHNYDYWIDSILGKFIMKFTIDKSVSYSKVECLFLKGQRSKYLKSLKTSIKMLLCEKHVMPLNWYLKRVDESMQSGKQFIKYLGVQLPSEVFYWEHPIVKKKVIFWRHLEVHSSL